MTVIDDRHLQDIKVCSLHPEPRKPLPLALQTAQHDGPALSLSQPHRQADDTAPENFSKCICWLKIWLRYSKPYRYWVSKAASGRHENSLTFPGAYVRSCSEPI